MDEEPYPFVVPVRGCVGGRLPAIAFVLGDGACDRLVKASIERAEVFRANRRIRFHCQIGRGLTDVTVVMNDL
jgi:hypothetical protein